MRRRTFAALAASALAAAPFRSRAASPSSVRLAYVPVLSLAPVMVAMERRYYADAGLDVDMISIATAQDAVALLARGRLDAAAGGISAAFFNAVRRGFKVRLAGCTTYIPKRGHPTALLVRTALYEKGVRNPQELRGQRIGLIGGLGTASSYYLGKLIWPLTFDDVDLVPLNGGDQGVALKRGSIAAAFAWNPFTQAFERNGIARVIAVPMPGTSTGGVLFGERALADAGLAKALRSATNRAIADIAGNGYYDAKNLAAIAKYVGQTPAAIVKDDRYDYPPGMPVDGRTLEAMQRLFIAEKTLAYPSPLSVASLTAKE